MIEWCNNDSISWCVQGFKQKTPAKIAQLHSLKLPSAGGLLLRDWLTEPDEQIYNDGHFWDKQASERRATVPWRLRTNTGDSTQEGTENIPKVRSQPSHFCQHGSSNKQNNN